MISRLNLAHFLADRLIFGAGPIDCGPVVLLVPLLLVPFGIHQWIPCPP